MDFDSLCDGLRTEPPAARRALWRALPNVAQQRRLNPAELDILRDLLLDERDLDIRTTGALLLDRVIHAQRAQPKPESFCDWLFSPFRPPLAPTAGASRAPSLVLTVCDAEYIRDVEAQVQIARYLPADRYAHTVFRHVPRHAPDWSDIKLERASAVCFIGRPSLFSDCPIAGRFPKDLRFTVDKAQDDDAFYSVVQRRPAAGPFAYPAVQSSAKSLREDFAIVQRFVVPVGSRHLTVITICGGTSLGTCAAASWVTSFDWSDRKTEYARLAGVASVDSFTRFEALLAVSAHVHAPARPWEPTVEDIGLFANNSHNLVRPPSRIFVVTESGALHTADDVQFVLFDDDEFQPASKTDYGAVLAVCVKYALDGRAEFGFEELLSNPALWPKGEAPKPGNPATFFRDHLQRRCLNGVVEVTASEVHLLERAILPLKRSDVRSRVRSSSRPTSASNGPAAARI